MNFILSMNPQLNLTKLELHKSQFFLTVKNINHVKNEERIEKLSKNHTFLRVKTINDNRIQITYECSYRMNAMFTACI